MELPLIRPGERICSSDELQECTSRKFRVLESDRPVEAFIIRFAGGFHAYVNRCAHMALTLDLEDNDFFSIDSKSLICKTHGAMYRPDDGFCFSGPCCGEYLDRLAVELRGAEIFLKGGAEGM